MAAVERLPRRLDGGGRGRAPVGQDRLLRRGGGPAGHGAVDRLHHQGIQPGRDRRLRRGGRERPGSGLAGTRRRPLWPGRPDLPGPGRGGRRRRLRLGMGEGALYPGRGFGGVRRPATGDRSLPPGGAHQRPDRDPRRRLRHAGHHEGPGRGPVLQLVRPVRHVDLHHRHGDGGPLWLLRSDQRRLQCGRRLGRGAVRRL
ncbi:hypothetical protein D3C85_1209200 [compost metagenome]